MLAKVVAVDAGRTVCLHVEDHRRCACKSPIARPAAHVTAAMGDHVLYSVGEALMESVTACQRTCSTLLSESWCLWHSGQSKFPIEMVHVLVEINEDLQAPSARLKVVSDEVVFKELPNSCTVEGAPVVVITQRKTG